MKRLLCFVITLVMLISAVPFAAFADVSAPPVTYIQNTAYYSLDSAEDLFWFSDQVNGGDVSINAILTGNVVINEKGLETSDLVEWTPIGKTSEYTFDGVFDGNGYIISGLYMYEDYYDMGLFAYNSGTVKNVILTGLDFSGDDDAELTPYIGGICAVNSGTISNCATSGEIYLGGSDRDGISDVAGGICAYNSGIIEYCVNKSNVTGYPYASGGIAVSCVAGISGENAGGTVISCYNLGKIHAKAGTRDWLADAGAAGIVGKNEKSGLVSKCVNVGTISANASGGREAVADTVVGGICIKNADQSTVEYCYNTGSLTAYSKITGNDGYVSAGAYVGGIIGENETQGKVKNSKSIGYISASAVAEGGYVIKQNELCGINSGEASRSSYTSTHFSDGTVCGSLSFHVYKEGVCDLCSATCQAHCFKDYVEIKTATCSAEGEYLRVCSNCFYDDSYKSGTDLSKHNYQKTTLQPTCTEQGYDEYLCTYCADSYKENITEKLEHNYTVTVTIPTCYDKGYTTYTCINCSDTYVDGYVEPSHTFVSNCDGICDVCGFERQTSGHVFDNLCDDCCNSCGYTRIVPDHVYTDICDGDCNVCGFSRTAPHDYTDKNNATFHWQLCQQCKQIINKTEHFYDNDCDAVCNGCTYQRTPPHVYDNNCDGECNNCDFTRTPSEHIYDNTCDTDCNECLAVREITHIYDSACDSDCNVCGFSRTAPHNYTDKNNATYHWQLCLGCKSIINKSEHFYDNDCDAVCNGCVYVRNAGHIFSKECDDVNHWFYCKQCGITRDVVSHSFDNSYDANCNGCKYVRSVSVPKISAVSMTVDKSLAYNLKVQGINEDATVSVVFRVDEKEYPVKKYTKEGDTFVFTLGSIGPHLMCDDITAEFTVTVGDTLIHSESYVTTLADYCKAISEQDESYKSLVNAVLNYGAAAQVYKNHNTENLANKSLYDYEKVFDKKDYFDGLDKEYLTISNSLADWKSAGLYLDSKARIKLSFESEQDLKGITVLVENEWFEEIAILENRIIKQGDRYVFYFDGFNINELDTIFLFTLCKDGKPISNTLSYSVESYAYRVNETTDTALIKLVNALMNYGAATKNY